MKGEGTAGDLGKMEIGQTRSTHERNGHPANWDAEVKPPSTSKGVLNRFAENTSFQGIAFIHNNKHWFHKSVWVALFLGALIATVWQLVTVVVKYYEFETSTTVELGYTTLPFPSVTVCNLNPVRASQLHLASADLQVFLKELEPDATYHGVLADGGQTTDTPSSVETTEENLDPGPTKRRRKRDAPDVNFLSGTVNFNFSSVKTFDIEDMDDDDDDDDDDDENQIYSNQENFGSGPRAWIDEVESTFKHLYGQQPRALQYKMGHPEDGLVIDCSFNGRVCSAQNFTLQGSRLYGNCFTFNSPKLRKLSLQSKRSGPRFGLTMVLFLDTTDHIDGLTSGNGARIAIHPFNTMPFLEEEGISVPAGFETNLALRLVNITRLKKPHGDCTDDTDFMTRYGRRYTIAACNNTCEDREIAKTCRCFRESNIDSYTDAEVAALSDCQDQHYDCVRAVLGRVASGKQSCDCKEPCHETLYEIDTSMNKWPNKGYWFSLVSIVCGKLGQHHESCEELLQTKPEDRDYILRHNFLMLKIYYKSLNFQTIKETESYEKSQFLSDLGGTAGLWVGASVLSLCEVVDLLASLITMCCRHMKNTPAKK